jgi:hypothetical protein
MHEQLRTASFLILGSKNDVENGWYGRYSGLIIGRK